MSLSSKKPTISIPEYKSPTPPSFSGFGQTASYGNGGYNLSMDPSALADYQAATKVRSDLIASLGLNGNQNDPYAKSFMDESLRIAQPRLENSLIERGLGGSSVYQGALTDLITKAGTDAVLNSGNQRNNALNTLQSSYFGPSQQLGQALLQLSASTGISQDQLAQALYQMQLPYTAQVNYPKNNGLGGAITGGLQGFMTGGPVGAVVGAGTGYFGSQADAYSQPYMLSDYYSKNNQGLTLQSLLGLTNGGRAFQ